MEKLKKSLIMEAFSSMRTTDNIKLEDIGCLERLKKYYVDPFGYLNSIIQKEDNFIIGRRGTGKSTLLYRGFAECIDTWKTERRVLPIYIDLSKCEALCSSDNNIQIEHLFAYELMRCLESSLKLVWDKIIPTNGRYEESNLHEILQDCINKVNDILRMGVPIKVECNEEKRGSVIKSDYNKKTEIKFKDFLVGKTDSKNSTKQTEETLHKEFSYTLAEFLDGLTTICDLVQIESIYVYIDEYSELKTDTQKVIAYLLKRLRGTRKNIFFKVCAITDNYELGEIRLQRDFYEISLDLYKMFERAKGLNDAFKRLSEFTENIIEERLKAYGCEKSIKTLLYSYKQAIELLARASMGVPRTLGIILKESWNQTMARGKEKISLDDLKFGIKTSGDGYYGFFNGNIGPVIPAFYGQMLKDIVERARAERKVSPGKSASMFMIGGFRDGHFKYLSENYLIHLVKKDETSVKGETGLSLYMLDWYFIDKYNLGFSIERDVYRQQRFVYNDIMKNYDAYFTDTRMAFRCPECRSEYTQEQLFLPQLNQYLDVCPKDYTKLEKIEKEYISASYTEVERKIVGTIRNHSFENAIMAKEVADIVGCSTMKVAKFAEKLCKSSQVIRREKKNESVYRYFCGIDND